MRTEGTAPKPVVFVWMPATTDSDDNGGRVDEDEDKVSSGDSVKAWVEFELIRARRFKAA